MKSARSAFTISPALAAAALALSAGWLLALDASPARADASAWDNEVGSSARLIAAKAQGEGAARVLRGGIEIRLKPGWKTYWRYPGDSGVPPTIDLSKSDNVKSVTILWPAPMRFDDGAGGQSIGYKNAVVLPLHVSPADPAKPVVLRLAMDYGACEKLCVPARARAELRLGASGAHEDAVATAEKRVPVKSTIGSGAPLAVTAVRRESSGGKPRVIVDVAAPAGSSVDLFAEGPSPDWALPLPEPAKDAPAGVRRFAFEIDGLPPGAKPEGAQLRLTAVAGERAVEIGFRLD